MSDEPHVWRTLDGREVTVETEPADWFVCRGCAGCGVVEDLDEGNEIIIRPCEVCLGAGGWVAESGAGQ